MIKSDKKILAEKLKIALADKKCLAIVKHKKILFSEIYAARKVCSSDTRIIKIKNTLAKVILKGSPYKEAFKELKNENLMIFGKDIFDVCKVAQNLQENASSTIIFAQDIDDVVYSSDQIKEISKLNSMGSLQSKLLSAISGVISKSIRVIDAKIRKDQGING